MRTPLGKDRWFLSYFPLNTAAGLSSPLAPLFITEILRGNVVDYSVFAIFSSLATIIGLFTWGPLSDRLGRRKVFVILAFVSLAVTSVLLSFSFSVTYFIAISFIAGFLGSAATPISSVLIMESSERRNWVFKISRFSLYSSYGQIAGVVFAAFFTGYVRNASSLRYLYIAAFLFYLISAVMANSLITEPKERVKRDEVEVRTFRVIERVRYLPSQIIHFNLHFRNLDKDLKRTIIGFFVMMTGFQLFFVAFPILLKTLYVNNSVFFLIYLGNYVFGAISFSFAGTFCSRYGNRMATIISVAGRIFLFPSIILMIAFIRSAPILFVSLLLLYSVLGALWSFISVGTATLVSNLSKPEERGRVSGTYNAVQSFGVVLGSLFTGIIVSRAGFDVNFLIASLVTAAGLAIFSRVKTR